LKAILLHAKGTGVLIAADNISRCLSWHDTPTNRRGGILEEILKRKQLNILNDESDYTIFQIRPGCSNIDKAVFSNQLPNPDLYYYIALRHLYCNITRVCTLDVSHKSSKPHGAMGKSVVLSANGI
jgi:hypothetical protein